MIANLPYWLQIIIFFGAQLLNVIFSAGRTILLVKGTKWQGVIANTIHYTINAATVSIISVVNNLWVTILVTMVSNFIGAIIAYEATKKMRKTRLWRVSLYVEKDKLAIVKEELAIENFVYITMGDESDTIRVVDVFSHDKKEGLELQKLIKKYTLPYVMIESQKAVTVK